MDDLQAISVMQRRSRPLIARYYLPVEFDGHAIWLHAESLDKRAQRFG